MGITILVLILVLILVVGINVIILVSGDEAGHLLSIGINQVAPVLLSVAGSADSLHHDASVEAIYLAPVVGEDVLHVIRATLLKLGWQFFQDIGELVKNKDVTAHLFLLRWAEGAHPSVL